MLIKLLNANDLIGCCGDHEPIKTVLGSINQSDSYQCDGGKFCAVTQ